MIILKILVLAVLVSAIIQFVRMYNAAGRALEAREAAERLERYKRIERDRIAAENAAKERIELLKQLEAVQYQLAILARLDSFRSDNWSDEKEVKKALSLEKQYNALWTKERKLKEKISALE
jgi:YD repeat-containing protein